MPPVVEFSAGLPTRRDLTRATACQGALTLKEGRGLAEAISAADSTQTIEIIDPATVL